MKTYISVKTKEQLAAARKSGRADEIIVPLFIARDLPGAADCYLLLPDVLRENKREIFEESAAFIKSAKGAVIQNADEIGFLKSIGLAGEIIAGELLYSYNSSAVHFYRDIFPDMKFIAPAELTDEELSGLEKAAGICFIYKAYGRQKLMTTAQTINGGFKDEKGEYFTAIYDNINVVSEIYTARPVSMLDKKEAWRGRDILLEFTSETAGETAAILDNMSVSDFSRGHHFKGID